MELNSRRSKQIVYYEKMVFSKYPNYKRKLQVDEYLNKKNCDSGRDSYFSEVSDASKDKESIFEKCF